MDPEKLEVVEIELVVETVVAHVLTTWTVLSCRVTAPLSAINDPETSAPVLALMEFCAKIMPVKAVSVQRVAEFPTCQTMLQSWSPFINVTAELELVVSVDPIRRTKRALVLPWAFRISLPVI